MSKTQLLQRISIIFFIVESMIMQFISKFAAFSSHVLDDKHGEGAIFTIRLPVDVPEQGSIE